MFGAGRHFFRGIADVDYIAIELLAYRPLLFSCGGNLNIHVGDTVNRAAYFGNRGSRFASCVDRLGHHILTLLHGDARFVSTLLQFGDDVVDLGSGVLGSFGQSADFICYHGETTTLFTGSGCLDCRIQCQQVGLLGNPLNDFKHHADISAVITQLADHQSSLFDGGSHLFNPAD